MKSVEKNFTVEQVKAALQTIQPKVSEQQMAMLAAHYRHRTLSMRKIALLGGYKEYRAGNLQYGCLCKRIAAQLGFVHRSKTYTIATGWEDDLQGHFQWRMDDVVVSALRDLRWFATRSRVHHNGSVAMTPKQLRRRIKGLKTHLPLTKEFEPDKCEGKPVWYKTQKEHWLGWLADFPGPGAYDRKKWLNPSAGFVYNHLLCPPMLLWLAEASGVPRKKMIEAKQAALYAGETFNAQCGAIREIIPWELVEARLKGRTF